MSENDREYQQDLDEAYRPALVGGFAYDRATDRWTWSTEVYRMHGFEPHDVVPTTELIRYHLHPDDGDAVLVKLWQALESGAPFSEHFRLVDANGTTRNVLALGTGETGSRSGAGLRGQMIDLSDMHHQIIREDVGPAVEDFQANPSRRQSAGRRPSCRVRSTSRCSALPSTRISRVHSEDAR